MDPWYDYFALPLAPLVLLAQIVALFLRPARLRRSVLVAAPLLIAAMLAYVSSRPVAPSEGVNIGEGVLVLWLVLSLGISLLGVVAESIRALAARRERA